MREGLVGFSHTMDFVTLLHGAATAFGRVEQFAGETLRHGLFRTLLGRFTEPAHGEGHTADRTDFDRNLIVGTTNAAGLDFHQRTDVVQGGGEHFQGVLAGLFFDLLEGAKGEDKCAFVLVKTSNPGSGELQDLKIADGRTIYEAMGELNESIAAGTQGKYGFTMAGAVTGATYPEQIQDLRARLPHTFFLVPGYGAQGGTAEDVKYAFNEKGHGAIVNSSRGIMCAWKKTGGDGHDFQEAARNAAIAMKEDIARFVTIQ